MYNYTQSTRVYSGSLVGEVRNRLIELNQVGF